MYQRLYFSDRENKEVNFMKIKIFTSACNFVFYYEYVTSVEIDIYATSAVNRLIARKCGIWTHSFLAHACRTYD